MLKINKSILIICMVSLFLIIGQISASDTDLIKINDSDTSNCQIESSNINSETICLDIKSNEKPNNSFFDDENPIEPNELNCDNSSIEPIEEKIKDTTGIVMANDNYSCGPASLATVLNKYGLNLSLNEVSKQTNTSINGTNMQSLIDAAKYYNFSAYGIGIDTPNLKENYIVHLNINGCQHWTVIRKLTDTHVFLADSTEGNINFTIDEFNSYSVNKSSVSLHAI